MWDVLGVDSLESMRRNYESDSGLLLRGIAFEKRRREYSATQPCMAAPHLAAHSRAAAAATGRGAGGQLCLLLLTA